MFTDLEYRQKKLEKLKQDHEKEEIELEKKVDIEQQKVWIFEHFIAHQFLSMSTVREIAKLKGIGRIMDSFVSKCAARFSWSL